MGLPGVAYLSGIASAAWTAIGLAIGTYVNWLIVARRIRVYSKAYEAFTVPDFFAKRFGDKKGILTGIAALMIIIFFIPYTASGFAACGKLFFQPVWGELYGSHDNQCSSHCRLLCIGRISGSKYNRFDSEYCYDNSRWWL